MRRLFIPLTITIFAGLVLAPSAWAKGPVTSLAVCGADGCSSVPVPARLRSPMGVDRLMMSARAAARMPAPGPFYRLRVGMEGAMMSFSYLPGGELLRDRDWVVLGAKLRSAIDAAVAGQAAIVPTLRAVSIVGRRVSDPQAYAPLLRRLPGSARTVNAAAKGSVGIYMTTSTSSPWGLDRVVFALYEPHAGLVDVAGAVRVPPASVRRAIQRDAGIGLARAPGDGGGGSGMVWAGGATAAAASAGVLLIRRRGRRGGEG